MSVKERSNERKRRIEAKRSTLGSRRREKPKKEKRGTQRRIRNSRVRLVVVFLQSKQESKRTEAKAEMRVRKRAKLNRDVLACLILETYTKVRSERCKRGTEMN